jgi:GST-like protein
VVGHERRALHPTESLDLATRRRRRQLASINRPIAGATHDAALPVGEYPLQLYSLATPNGVKVTDDARGAARARPRRRRVRRLAEKLGALLPTAPAARAACLSWLFWQMGSALFVGGGFGHFYVYAPTQIEYAIDRYAMETKRQLDVLDRHLATSTYLAGDAYTIADIAAWPWYGGLVRGELYSAAEFLGVEAYAHVRRWADAIAARRRCSAGARSTARSARPPTSCTSGTTPATSSCARRTS